MTSSPRASLEMTSRPFSDVTAAAAAGQGGTAVAPVLGDWATLAAAAVRPVNEVDKAT